MPARKGNIDYYAVTFKSVDHKCGRLSRGKKGLGSSQTKY